MVRSNAEIQRAYRERMKSKLGNDLYKQKEAERKRKAYVSHSQLSKSDLKKARQKKRDAKRKSKRKMSDVDTQHKKKRSKAINKYKRKLKEMEEREKLLEKKVKTLRKKCSRRKKVSQHPRVERAATVENVLSSGEAMSLEEDMSPSDKATMQLENAGLSKSSHPEIYRDLKLHHAVIGEMQNACEKEKNVVTRKKKKLNQMSVITGSILRKYRLGSRLSKATGINRKMVARSDNNIPRQKSAQMLAYENEKKQIVEFMSQDENSTCCPGKKDFTKVDGEKCQQRILNDYIYNLHSKYLAENPSSKISLNFFRLCRPPYIKLVKFGSRNTCLCTRHQNIALKLQALKTIGVTTVVNPDVFVNNTSDDEIERKMREIDDDSVTYCEWKSIEIEVPGKGKQKGSTITKRKCVQLTHNVLREDFEKIFLQDVKEFREHIERVKTQYQGVRDLKLKMSCNEAIVQMDFAENYRCDHADEVQSAYFDKGMITLQPAVVYYKSSDDANTELQHKSFVFVSAELSHGALTVFTIMTQLVPQVKQLVPHLTGIHYVTDSPFSQYRNRTIFFIVANHMKLFKVQASWLYLEAGHGKGPCDGVGGTVKRLAEQAVRNKTCSIQNADEFYDWGVKSGQAITYILVPKSDCEKNSQLISKWPTEGIEQTKTIHHICGDSRATARSPILLIRKTSCVCDSCYNDGKFHVHCDGWMEVKLKSLTKAMLPK